MSLNNQTKPNGRGGSRKGAGRKPGSANVKTREIADKAAREGITPLEVMLENMTFAHKEASGILMKLVEGGAETPDAFNEFKELLRFRGIAQEAAKDAAPYVHPRLASVEMNANVTVKSLDQELADLNAKRDAEGRSSLA